MLSEWQLCFVYRRTNWSENRSFCHQFLFYQRANYGNHLHSSYLQYIVPHVSKTFVFLHNFWKN